MRIEVPARPSGSLVPPLGRVSKQWLPLTSLVFLLIALMAVANQIQTVKAIDSKVVQPVEQPTPKPPSSRNPHKNAG